MEEIGSLRKRVIDKIMRWEGLYPDDRWKVRRILLKMSGTAGYGDNYYISPTDVDVDKFQLLDGPHGRTVWELVKVRYGNIADACDSL